MTYTIALTNRQPLHGQAFDGASVRLTGVTEFIGSHLSETMIDLGAEVVLLDDLSDVTNFDEQVPTCP